MCWTEPCSTRSSASSEIPPVCPLPFPQDAAVLRKLPCPEGSLSDLLERDIVCQPHWDTNSLRQYKSLSYLM